MADLPQRESGGPPARTPSDAVPARTVASDHLLPAGGSAISRIAQHGKGLVDDLSTWVDLRIKLAKLEIQEELQQQKNQIAVMAVAGVFGALGGLFALLALALGVSALFALVLSWPLSLFLGFLVVTMLLLAIAAIVYKSQPTFFPGEPRVAVDEGELRPGVSGDGAPGAPGDPRRPSTPPGEPAPASSSDR